MSASSSTTLTAETGRKRRKMTIEDALRWAIRDELPKRRDDRRISAPPSPPVSPMWRMGVFGGPIDNWNREPGFPAAMGDPHPDALVIEQQLEALGEQLKRAAIGAAVCPLDVQPYPIQVELRGKADIEVLISNALHATPAWLATCAINGTRPEVGYGPACEPQRSSNGKITLWREVQTPMGTGPDGRPWFDVHHVEATSKGDARDTGLFCKLVWTRGGVEIVEEQLRYAFWHASLVHLVPELQFLTSIEILPPRAVPTPWFEREPEPLSPLANVTGERRARLQARLCRPSEAALDARPNAVRRAPRRRPSEVRRIDPAGWQDPRERSA